MENIIIYSVITFFVVLSIIFTIRYCIKIKNYYNTLLTAMKDFSSQISCLELDKKNFQNCFSNLKVNKLLLDLWEEYQNCLNLNYLKSYESPEKFFYTENLLNEQMKSREFIKAFPGILTSWGLLGTFIAILVSLFFLDVNPITGDVTGIEQLVSGLSSKFISSIVALSCAIIFIWQERHRYSKLNKECLILCKNLKKKFPIVSTAKLLATISGKLDSQLDAFEKVGQNLEQTSVESLRKMVEIFQETLTSSTLEQFSTINNTIKDLAVTVEKVQSIQNDFVHKMEQISNITEESIQNQKEQIEKINEIISITNDKSVFFKETIESCNNITDKLSNITGEIAHAGEQFAEALPGLKSTEKTITILNDSLDKNIQYFKTISEEFVNNKPGFIITNFEQTIKNTLLEIQVGLNQDSEIIKDNVEWYGQQLDKLVETADNTIDKVHTSMSNYAIVTEKFLSQYDESMSKAISYLNTNVDHLNDSMKDNINNLVNNIDTLKNNFQNLNLALNNVLTEKEHVNE